MSALYMLLVIWIGIPCLVGAAMALTPSTVVCAPTYEPLQIKALLAPTSLYTALCSIGRPMGRYIALASFTVLLAHAVYDMGPNGGWRSARDTVVARR
jgi:hypothetical protein